MDRIPNLVPHDLETEMAVLGAMLLGDRGAIDRACEVLTRDDFYRDAHAHIYDSMVALTERDEPVDIVTLKDELQRKGILEGIGGVDYLMQLGDSQFTTANISHYANIVRDKAVLRRLAIAAEGIRQRIFEPSDETAVDQCARAEQAILGCAGSKSSSANANWQSPKDLFPAVWAGIDERQMAGGAISGLSTGLEAVDRITHGFRPGALVTLAARTAMGKTALAMSIATSVAKRGEAVAVFSCEMPGTDILQRAWAAESGIPFRVIESGRWTDGDRARLQDAQEAIFHMPLYITDRSRLSITALAGQVRRLHAHHPLSLIVVDYVQYLDGVEGRRYPSEREKIIDIIKGLKQVARDINVPVLALSQLNRANERRDDKRPVLSDIAESGRIEAESDIVMFLYRPAYYAPAEVSSESERHTDTSIDGSEDVELIVAKNRNGQTGFVKLAFEPKLMRFSDLASGPHL